MFKYITDTLKELEQHKFIAVEVGGSFSEDCLLIITDGILQVLVGLKSLIDYSIILESIFSHMRLASNPH